MTDPKSFHDFTLDGSVYRTRLTKKFENRKMYVRHDPHQVLCVIPGVIRRVYVNEGDSVAEGSPLCVLEAMKMENDVLAPLSGRVKQIVVHEGDLVGKSDLLIELE